MLQQKPLCGKYIGESNENLELLPANSVQTVLVQFYNFFSILPDLLNR